MNERLKKPVSRRGRYIGYGLIGFILLCFSAIVFNRVHTVSGTGESHAAASEKCWMIKEYLPADASDINYYSKPYMVILQANFALPEDSFLSWAEQQGWKVEAEENVRLNAGWTPKELKGRTKESANSAYTVFHNIERKDGKNVTFAQTWLVTYDRDDGIVYLSITTMD